MKQLSSQLPDDPQGFGFKTKWWALPTTDTEAVVAAVRLRDAQPANWRTGIERAYEGSVFVAPPIEGWTLITGVNLSPDGAEPRRDVIKPLLALSRLFETALVFATHRVVEYHLWAKAVAGELVRGYGYLGESGLTLWDEGPKTREELELSFAFFDERRPEAEMDSYWEREDLRSAGEMDVMDLAGKWSVCPCTLDAYRPNEKRLGVLGSRSGLLGGGSGAT